MSNDAELFINKKYEELRVKSDENYTSLTIRLPPSDALMVKAISERLNFTVSTVFTKFISKHIYDLALRLNDKDFDKFLDKLCEYGCEAYWYKKMLEDKMLDKSTLSFAFKKDLEERIEEGRKVMYFKEKLYQDDIKKQSEESKGIL